MPTDELVLMTELSKINFLLENLYARTLVNHGYCPDDVEDLADEMCRQAQLPGTRYGSVDEEFEAEQRDLLEQRLAMFFSQVRDRVKQAQGRDGR